MNLQVFEMMIELVRTKLIGENSEAIDVLPDFTEEDVIEMFEDFKKKLKESTALERKEEEKSKAKTKEKEKATSKKKDDESDGELGYEWVQGDGLDVEEYEED